MKMKTYFSYALLTTGIILAQNSSATENGLTVYPIGVNTVLNGIMPSPGDTQFYNYAQYYTADKYAGADGNSVISDFNINLFVEAPRIMHTWDKMLGDYTISSGVIVPFINLSSSTSSSSGKKTGMGDIIIQPFNLGFTNDTHTLFGYTALDFSLPTGSYSKDRIANTGVNYATFMPSINLTWFPSRKLELSATLLAQFNQKNKDTDYKSGSTAALDYNMGYSINEKLQVGLQGFHLEQFTDDIVKGNSYLNGNRAKVSGIGPQIRYDIVQGGALVFKYQREFNAENHTEGDKYWLQFSMPIL